MLLFMPFSILYHSKLKILLELTEDDKSSN